MPQLLSAPPYRVRHLARTLTAIAFALTMTAWAGCGEDHGRPRSAPAAPAREGSEVGRYRIEALRVGVPRAMMVLFDSSTGEVRERPVGGRSAFRPINDEDPPGAAAPIRVGRFDLQVVPGRKGSALLRLNVITGETWLLHLNLEPLRWIKIPSLSDYREAVPRTPGIDPNLRPGSEKSPPIETLTQVLNDREKSSDLRTGAASLILEKHPGKAAEALLPILSAEDEDVEVLVFVIESVPVAGNVDIAMAIQTLMRHPDDRVAEAARKKLSSDR